MTTTTNPQRIVRCRMTDPLGGLCTAEAVDPDGELIICSRHLALALELIKQRAPGMVHLHQVIAYEWTDPRSGAVRRLHPADVAAVIPDRRT